MAQLRGRVLRAGARRDEAGPALGGGSALRASPGTPAPGFAVFREAVLAIVERIPEGSVASYVQIARMAGWPRRPRQVGMVLKGLPEDTEAPWHRVVNNHGHIPSQGRWWGAEVQAIRLREEGIAVDAKGNLDIETYRWDGE